MISTCVDCRAPFEQPAPGPRSWPASRCPECTNKKRDRITWLVGTVAEVGDRFGFIVSGNMRFLFHTDEVPIALGVRVKFRADPTERPTLGGKTPIARSVEVLT